MKWLVTWWFLDGKNGISRGHDIVEAPKDFDEDDADKLLNAEMWDNLGNHKTKNFAKNTCSPKPVTWGVLRVKRVRRQNK